MFSAYNLTEHLSICLGLGYLNNGEARNWHKEPALGVPDPNSLWYLKKRTSKNYLEIPLNIKYQFARRFFFIGGASANIKLAYYHIYKIYLLDGTIQRKRSLQSNSSYKSINPMINFGFGYNLFSYNGFDLFIQQYAQLGITRRVSKYDNSSFVDYSLGIGIGAHIF